VCLDGTQDGVTEGIGIDLWQDSSGVMLQGGGYEGESSKYDKLIHLINLINHIIHWTA
jgi:hypothetical protein